MTRQTATPLLCLAVLLAVQTAARADRNVLDVEYRILPADFETLPAREPEKWNFNFQPYGKSSAEMLWTDPIVRREALAGGADGKPPPATAIYACCDDEGFTLLVLAVETGWREALENGSRAPRSALECFFQPGDSDSSDIEHYYQFICDTREPCIQGIFPWMTEDRSFRSIEGALQVTARELPHANVVRIRVPWEPLFDRLPFSRKADNLWRLSVIRWAATGGQTWGGNVHQQTSCGYLRFPDFTPEQRAAMMRHCLGRAWERYQTVLAAKDVSPAFVPLGGRRRPPFFFDDLARNPHTFINVNEDAAFRAAWLDGAVAARNALGAGLAAFDTLPSAEQAAFYTRASDMLFNFRYDIEQAYGAYQTDLIFGEEQGAP